MEAADRDELTDAERDAALAEGMVAPPAGSMEFLTARPDRDAGQRPHQQAADKAEHGAFVKQVAPFFEADKANDQAKLKKLIGELAAAGTASWRLLTGSVCRRGEGDRYMFPSTRRTVISMTTRSGSCVSRESNVGSEKSCGSTFRNSSCWSVSHDAMPSTARLRHKRDSSQMRSASAATSWGRR